MKYRERKGVVYFHDYRDAREHKNRYAPNDGRIVSYDLGWAVQVRISGPYLNAKGELN
jgi:hypothetical protein